MKETSLRRRLGRGQRTAGVLTPWVNSEIIEIAAQAGIDFAVLDAEHGPLTPAICEPALVAAELHGLPVLVRVAKNDRSLIGQYLDLGAAGVIIPHIDSAAAARNAVSASRYPPLGVRGLGPCRANAFGLSDPAAGMQRANESVLVIVQIEDGQAVERAEEIAGVKGVDGVLIGPRDLASSMGYAGDSNQPAVQEAITNVIEVVLAAQRMVVYPTADADTAKGDWDRGAAMVMTYLPGLLHQAVGTLVQARE
ncbi:MAG: aldolase/citrate lyase family protein [Thermaerobacterales bacterium]